MRLSADMNRFLSSTVEDSALLPASRRPLLPLRAQPGLKRPPAPRLARERDRGEPGLRLREPRSGGDAVGVVGGDTLKQKTLAVSETRRRLPREINAAGATSSSFPAFPGSFSRFLVTPRPSSASSPLSSSRSFSRYAARGPEFASSASPRPPSVASRNSKPVSSLSASVASRSCAASSLGSPSSSVAAFDSPSTLPASAALSPASPPPFLLSPPTPVQTSATPRLLGAARASRSLSSVSASSVSLATPPLSPAPPVSSWRQFSSSSSSSSSSSPGCFGPQRRRRLPLWNVEVSRAAPAGREAPGEDATRRDGGERGEGEAHTGKRDEDLLGESDDSASLLQLTNRSTPSGLAAFARAADPSEDQSSPSTFSSSSSAPLAAAVRAATAAVKRSYHESAFWRELGDEAARILLRLQEFTHRGSACSFSSAFEAGSEDEDEAALAGAAAASPLSTSFSLAPAESPDAGFSQFGRDLSVLVNRFKQIRFFHERFLQTAEQAALGSMHLLSLHDAALLASSFASLQCNNPSFFFSLADHVYQVATSPSPAVARMAQTALRALREASSAVHASPLSAARRRDAFLASLAPSASFPLSLLLATARAPGTERRSRVHFPAAQGAASQAGALDVSEEIEIHLCLSWVHLLSGFAHAHVAHANLFEIAALPLCALLEAKAGSLLLMQKRVMARRSVERARKACAAGARMQLSLPRDGTPRRRQSSRGDGRAETVGTDEEGIEAIHGHLMVSAGTCGGKAARATMPGRLVAKIVEAYATFRFKHERLLLAATSTVSFLSFTDSDIESLRRSMEKLDFASPEFDRFASMRLPPAARR